MQHARLWSMAIASIYCLTREIVVLPISYLKRKVSLDSMI